MTRALLQQAQQPEALRLAEGINLAWLENVNSELIDIQMIQDELRRLHAENEALRAELAKPEQVPGEEWFGQSNIESPYNACQHKNYCLQLKAQPAQEPTTAVSLQCAHCQITIEQLNDKVMSLMKQFEQEPISDGDTAKLVNKLRDIAIEFHDSQQLRERIAQVIRPLTAQPAQEPLTNAKIDEIAGPGPDYFDRRVFARAIEAAHGIGGKV